MEKIDSFEKEYKSYDWSSRDIDNLIFFLHGDVSTNIEVIKIVVSLIVPEEYSNSPLEVPKDLKKDIILKRSKKKICCLILKEMNKIFNVKKFKKYFMKFQLEEKSLRNLDEVLIQCHQTLNRWDEWLQSQKKIKNDRIMLSLKKILIELKETNMRKN